MIPPSGHPAPPAFDLFNVYFERIYDPTMHLVFAFDGHLDEAVLKTATLRLLESDPYLRSRFAEDDGMPRWEEILEVEGGERAFVILSSNGEGGEENAPPFPPEIPPAPPLDVRRGPQLRVSLLREEGGDRVTVTCIMASVTRVVSGIWHKTSLPRMEKSSATRTSGPLPPGGMTAAWRRSSPGSVRMRCMRHRKTRSRSLTAGGFPVRER
ncbi:hypothetical protein [Methanogenium cariaci]|uniref:hypothetical protein n=1 Tax=Methanogenium cariaci TaxID=2197 RepID=UPI0007821B60|nr:hypothetical protein [Methanogenium cariaci]